MIGTLQTKYATELDYLRLTLYSLGITTVDDFILVVQIDNAYKAIKRYLKLNDNTNENGGANNTSDSSAVWQDMEDDTDSGSNAVWENMIEMDDVEKALPDYFNAAVELAITYYSNYLVELNKTTGKRMVTQQTQGSRSWTFATSDSNLDSYGLTEKVKALLPYPPVWAR